MELKGYQQTNIDALDRFLCYVDKHKNTATGHTFSRNYH